MKVTIEGQKLRKVLKQTVFASDAESTRYALGGVYLDGENAVSTDGRRLALQPIDLAIADPFLLPAPAARKIAAGITKRVKDVTIEKNGKWSASWLDAKRQPKVVEFEVIDGRFPKYEDILQDTSKAIGTIAGNAEVLLESFNDIEDQRGWLFDLNSKTGVSASRSISRTRLAYTGDGLEILFDPSLVVDWLRTLHEDSKVTIYFFDFDRAVQCESDCGSVYVFMPMSLDR